jgi:hypothetical protein
MPLFRGESPVWKLDIVAGDLGRPARSNSGIDSMVSPSERETNTSPSSRRESHPTKSRTRTLVALWATDTPLAWAAVGIVSSNR